MRVACVQVFPVQPQPCLHSGAEVLYHHIGIGHQLVENGAPLGLFQVKRQAAFVIVQVQKVRAFAIRVAGGVTGRFDLDDIGPPVGELLHAGRAGTDARQVQHPEPAQWSFTRSGHGRSSTGTTRSSRIETQTGAFSSNTCSAGAAARSTVLLPSILRP